MSPLAGNEVIGRDSIVHITYSSADGYTAGLTANGRFRIWRPNGLPFKTSSATNYVDPIGDFIKMDLFTIDGKTSLLIAAESGLWQWNFNDSVPFASIEVPEQSILGYEWLDDEDILLLFRYVQPLRLNLSTGET